MKQFLLQFFTWWNGQTIGTRFFTWRKGQFVGTDEQGNRYYRAQQRELDPSVGTERRWVIYNGVVEASRVPPSWRAWLTYTRETPPSDEQYTPYKWEKPHLSNMTGTAEAYRPKGSQLAQPAPAAPAVGYAPWTPSE